MYIDTCIYIYIHTNCQCPTRLDNPTHSSDSESSGAFSHDAMRLLPKRPCLSLLRSNKHTKPNATPHPKAYEFIPIQPPIQLIILLCVGKPLKVLFKYAGRLVMPYDFESKLDRRSATQAINWPHITKRLCKPQQYEVQPFGRDAATYGRHGPP